MYLVADGYAQNRSKLVIIPVGRRCMHHDIPRRLPGLQVRHEHRHLDTVFSGLGDKAEHVARRKAFNRGWCELAGFWTSGASLRLNMLLFKVRVLSTGVSGLSALQAAPNECSALDAMLTRKLRCILGGAACREDVHDGYKAWHNEKVLRRCGPCPLFLELCVQRFKWYQRIFSDPERNRHFPVGTQGLPSRAVPNRTRAVLARNLA